MIVFDVKIYIYKYEISSNFCNKMYQMPANLKFGQCEKKWGTKSSRREQKSTKFNICSHLQLMQAYTQPLPDNSSLGRSLKFQCGALRRAILYFDILTTIEIMTCSGFQISEEVYAYFYLYFCAKNVVKTICAYLMS